MADRYISRECPKKILDVTCGGRTIWFNKNHPAAIYCDVRDEECTGVWKSTNRDSKRTCIVHPDVLCDFTDLPFPDNSFALVVFDPPHLRRISENAWLRKEYGQLGENWREMLHDGFRECMRVLKPDGVLIFKWAETQIPAADVWAAIGERPLFGHHSGKKSQTFWGCFMKLEGRMNVGDIYRWMPAADVAPVVHGRWEWFDEDTGTPITGYEREWGWRCTHCKEELSDDYDDPDCCPEIRFCPNCGAKMDGGDNDAINP